jgi:TonB family protein
MALILVVEQEGRYIERIRDALGSEGWRAKVVGASSDALRAASSEAPSLVLVNAELEGAASLYASFARRSGGPGVVALVSERQVGEATAERLAVDDVLPKPFTDQQLRLVVRRGLAGTRQPGAGRPSSPAAEGDDDGRLTSQEIFGDLVAEIESEVSATEAPAAPAPPPAAVAPAPAAAPPPPRAARPLDDADIERRLEETLSGVLGADRRPRPPAPKPKRRARDADVDTLLSETLSGLDLGRSRPARPPAPTPAAAPTPAPDPTPTPPPAASAPVPSPALAAGAPPAEPTPPPAPAPPPAPDFRDLFGDLDLSELENLARPQRRAAPPPEAPPPAPAEAGPLVAEPLPALEFEPPPALVEGVEQFGQYSLLERIAVGGMAEVWKARMRGVEGFQKTVAIKRILPHLTDSGDFVTMFIDEAKLAAQLNHPNIAHIYDLGKLGEHYYIAMEYVEGQNLRAILNAARDKAMPLPVGLGLLVGARLASALDYAHRKRDFDQRELGLVHRDVSPQNVLISFEGDIKLCDFGIAKAVDNASRTQMGALKGKLQYMSPEQAWGRPVDPRSDIFSLGSLLFEMLTGRRLFTGDNEISVLEAVRECHVDPPRELNPDVSPEADAIVLQALAKDPADRYQNAGELQHDLEQVLYARKPTPGPADLAAYLERLRNAPAAPAAAERPAERTAGGGSRPSAAAPFTPAPPPQQTPPPTVPGDAQTPFAPAEVAPAEPAATGAGRAAAAGGELQAVAPVGEVAVEEGSGRGRGLLIAAILIVLAAGIAAAVYFGLVGRRAPAAAPGPAGPSTDAVEQAAPGAEGAAPAADGTAPAAPAPAESGEAPPLPAAEVKGAAAKPPAESAPAAPTADEAMKKLVDQELARREQAMRNKLEAEQKRLEEELARAKAQQKAPASAGRSAPAAESSAPAPGKGADEAPKPPTAPPPSQAALIAPATPAQPAVQLASGDTAPALTAFAGGGAAAQAEPLATGPPGAPSPAATTREAPLHEPAVRPPKIEVGALVEPGPDVTPPKLVTIQKPEYPPLARQLRVDGEVVLAVLVDENGKVVDVRLVEQVAQRVGINEAAVAAARTARYEPATKGGVPVKMWMSLRIPFRL